MTVVGTAGTPQGMELVKNNGAHLVYNHRYKPHSASRRLINSSPVGRRHSLDSFRNVHSLDRTLIHHLLFIHREKGYLEQAAEAVGGDGFDVIIENASDINLGSDLTVIGPGARVVVCYLGRKSV